MNIAPIEFKNVTKIEKVKLSADTKTLPKTNQGINCTSVNSAGLESWVSSKSSLSPIENRWTAS